MKTQRVGGALARTARFAAVALVGLAGTAPAPTYAQSAGGEVAKQPVVTYNTDVFRYWYLDAEAWAKGLPPLQKEQAENSRAVADVQLAQAAPRH